MRRDLASAYLASAAKIGSWVVVSAILFRWYGPEPFAIVALARATLSVLNYTALGLAPAMLHMLARALAKPQQVIPVENHRPRVLWYAGRLQTPRSYEPIHSLYSNGLIIALTCGVLAAGIALLYGSYFRVLHEVPAHTFWFRLPSYGSEFSAAFGVGIALRLASDASGAVLQARRLIAVDNLLLAGADALWILLTLDRTEPNGHWGDITRVGFAFLESSVALFISRFVLAAAVTRPFKFFTPPLDLSLMSRLLGTGLLITFAQLADFLYAPVDLILINRLLDPTLVAAYAPVVQIDAGLFLLTAGIASVLLPRTALAHAVGERLLIRQYYVKGTLASAVILATAAISVWVFAPWIFRLWLGDPMPQTQAILPLVLIHTVVGGSSAVGRSILLGMGKVKPFTIAAIASGVANVVLSYCFVRFFGWGLYGIVIGTIVVVVARAGIWMPWYVLRTLRDERGPMQPADPMPPPEAPLG